MQQATGSMQKATGRRQQAPYTNCGECGSDAVTKGNPKRGRTMLNAPIQRKEEW
jgi:hypothetical protein